MLTLVFFFLRLFLVSPEDHCHMERNEEIDKKARKKLLIASALCVIFMIAEIVGNITKYVIRVNENNTLSKLFTKADSYHV